MHSRNHKRLVGWLAFAATLLTVLVVTLAPRLAYAAFVPACEADQITLLPREWLARPAAPPEACTLGAALAAPEEGGDARVAAMCDDRGASVIAPQRILPVSDARIEAGSACQGPEVVGPSCDVGPKDVPAGPPAFAVADHAVLGAALLVPPAPSELGPAFLPVIENERVGVRRAIDHPPR